jgi:ketosteroid isomerase-like protein
MAGPSPAAPDDPRVELILRVYSAASAEQVDEYLDTTHPDGVADWSRSRGPYMGVYRGRDEVVRFFAAVREAWGEFEYFHDELIDAGPDRIVRVGGMRARGRGSGIPIQATGAQLFEFKDGLIWRVTLYQDRAEALAAAGLA